MLLALSSFSVAVIVSERGSMSQLLLETVEGL